MRNKNIKMKYCNFYITRIQYEEIKTISEKLGMCYSELIRRALDQYIKENKNE